MRIYVPTSVAQYRAYGDSITYGYTLPYPQLQSYATLVAEYEKVTFANNAIPGDQVCDVPARQIFPNQDSPTLATHPVYTLLIGTNDADYEGAGSYESVFEQCYQAAVSWIAIPAEYKVLANDSRVTSTGGGAIDTSNHWDAWVTSGLGSTVSFAITMNESGPIYAWPRIDDKNPGTYSYSLDGIIIGTGSTRTIPSIATHNGTTNSLGFLRLAPVAAGRHVVTFTQTSVGSNGVAVVGIGTPIGPTGNKLPHVLLGTIPYQLENPSNPCNSPNGACEEYIRDIEADVNVFSSDRLDVQIFDTRKYMFGKPSEMNDVLHPNVLGQTELSHCVEASWPTTTGL